MSVFFSLLLAAQVYAGAVSIGSIATRPSIPLFRILRHGRPQLLLCTFS